jgi:hypothetical protein
MPAMRFHAGGDDITCASGACDPSAGLTWVVVARKNVWSAWGGLADLEGSAINTVKTSLELDAGTGPSNLSYATQASSAIPSTPANAQVSSLTNFYGLVSTRGPSTTNAAFGKIDLTAGGSYATSASTSAPLYTTTPTKAVFGRWNATDDFDGWLAVVAYFNGVLSSAQQAECFANKRTSDIWNNSFGRPAGLWEFNVSPSSVVDLTGNGANWTQTHGAPSLDGAVTPPWTYDGTGVMPPATAVGQMGWGTMGAGDMGTSFGGTLSTPIAGVDAFALGESASVQILVPATDSLTLGDTAVSSIAADLQRVDSAVQSEGTTAVDVALAASDALTETDQAASVGSQLSLSANDSQAVTEASSVQTQNALAASDAASVSESPSVVAVAVAAAETHTQIEPSPGGNLLVGETTFVDETTLLPDDFSASVAVATAASDSVSVSESSALSQGYTANDTQTQGEASAVTATMPLSDSGAFTDLSAVAAALQRADSWAFTDSPAAIQSVTLMQASDSWTVAEAVASLTSTDLKSASDVLTVTDTVQGINATVSASDLIGLLESSAISAALLTGEAFSMTELSAVQAVQLVTANDLQTQGEGNTSVSAALATSDSGSLSEASLIAGTVFFSANDSQTQDEQSAIAADLSRSDSSTFNDTSALATILSLSASDSASQSEQPSALSATLAASDGASVTDLVLDLAQTLQKAANDSFGLNESSSLAQIVAITRTDAFTLTAEVAGVVHLTTAPYIHHKVPLDGLVQELPVGGTVLAMVADGVVVAAVAAGSASDNATLGTPPTYGGSGVVLDVLTLVRLPHTRRTPP